MQPFTVTVLDEVAPGPPDVEDELDTLPPPAWTFTDEPPAELLLESDPVPPVVEDDPAAVMLPSACFSTETLQVSPEEATFDVAMSSAHRGFRLFGPSWCCDEMSATLVCPDDQP